MNRLSAASVAVIASFIAAPAFAQDHDWSGFYIGGNFGYTVTDSNTEFVNPAFPDIPSDQSGFHGGLQVGANFQTGVIVLGVEASASFGDIGATYDDPVSGSPETVTAGSDYQAALLGRAGVGLGNMLPYLTAGVVAAHVHTEATVDPSLTDDGMFYGLGYGAGIEVALDDNWSIRGQYLHTDLSGENFNPGPAETSSNLSSDTVTFGVNFSF